MVVAKFAEADGVFGVSPVSWTGFERGGVIMFPRCLCAIPVPPKCFLVQRILVFY